MRALLSTKITEYDSNKINYVYWGVANTFAIQLFKLISSSTT